MIESLNKAEHSAGFLLDEVRDAYVKSDSLTGIMLYGIVKDAADLYTKIKQINAALLEVTHAKTS